MKNVLMAVSGPSGVGKGTIVKRIIAEREDVVESVSCTTREPREGEIDGYSYFFLSQEEFARRIKQDEFLEYDEHFGALYGTPKSFVAEKLKSKSVIMEIDVVGALNAQKFFPETVLVMVLPPSLEELKARLKARNTETEEEIEKRLARIDYEVSQKDKYDYVIINDNLEEAIQTVKDIIDKEKTI